MSCEFCQITAEDEIFLLHETEHWKVYLSYHQSFLGRCIIPLKRHAGDLSALTPAEWLDLHQVIATMEGTLRKAFGATLFNWSCLMNAAYQAEKPEPHVHWHLRPRYAQPVRFEGITFADVAFGHHYKNAPEKGTPVPREVCLRIGERIRECL